MEDDNLNFNNIALALPGGGFRAACFSLGILKFLESMDLQQSIKVISTVSGGTITGARYAYACSQGEDFSDFYQETYDWLLKNDLFKKALSSLSNHKLFGDKSRNIINACALEYQKFVPITFQELEDGIKSNSKKFGLQEVIFNATDFEKGLHFRFQIEGDFGNGKKKHLSPLKQYVKLGDIIAASSCFPGGFEPIIFPKDFVDVKALDKIREVDELEIENFGLMDGGIMDNQGTTSLLNRTKDKKYSYLIADAGNFTFDKYTPSNDWLFAKILNVAFSIWTWLIMFALTMLLIYLEYYNIMIIPLILLSILTTVQIIFRTSVSMVKNYLKLENFKLPRSKIGTYIIDRINSVALLNSTIFLKSSKSSNLSEIYSKFSKNTTKLSIYSFIHEVNESNPNGKPVNARDWKDIKEQTGEISSFLQQLSKFSADYLTTLWFADDANKEATLNKLILCGEAVCCFGMLSRLISDGDISSPLFKKLLGRWEIYNSIPVKQFNKMNDYKMQA